METTPDHLAKSASSFSEESLLARKPEAIQAMFSRVASGYDLLNFVLGGGTDRWWRYVLVSSVKAQRPARVLDLATGSGDVLRALHRAKAFTERAAGADFCFPMLQVAQKKKLPNLVVGDALKLPFRTGTFDAITISFGFRNLVDRKAGLLEMRRVLRPGGKVYILEFSHPVWWFAWLYFAYLKNIMPLYASFFTKERGAYAYLGSSIRAFPRQEMLKTMMEECGFKNIRWSNLTLGIVALHQGVTDLESSVTLHPVQKRVGVDHGKPIGSKFFSLAWKRLPTLERVALGAFLFWVVAGLIFTLTPFSRAQVVGWGTPQWAVQFGDLCLAWGDPVLIVLAFVNSHLVASRQWGIQIARHWGFVVVLLSAVIETAGVKTGLIFGHYHYTDHFGPMLGVIPFTIPLAWHIVLTQCLLLVRVVKPDLTTASEAAFVATLATAYDWLLEPFATQVKHYWIWESNGIPLQNYAAWWLLSFLVTWFWAPTASSRWREDMRPWIIIGATLVIFVAGRL